MNNQVLIFENKELQVIKDEQGEWLSTEEINKAFGYNKARYTRELYYKHKDEFIEIEQGCHNPSHPSTRLVSIQTAGGMQQSRVFNLRGALLLALYSQTETGKKFREFILDILTGEKPLLSPQYNFLKDYFYENEPKIKAYLQYNKMGLSDIETMRLLKINRLELETFQKNLVSIGENILENTPVFMGLKTKESFPIPTTTLGEIDMEKLEYIGSYREYGDKYKLPRKQAIVLFEDWKVANKIVKINRKNYLIKD